MKKYFRSLAITAATVAALAASATSSSAVQYYTVTVSGTTTTCVGNESGTSTSAKITNATCNQVRATLRYVDSGGTTRTVTGGWKPYVSTATGGTMVTYRAGQGQMSIMDVPRNSGYYPFTL